MGFICADRSQQNLIGYSINDFAKSDEKSRFVVSTVSLLDLKSLYARYSDQGGDSFAPEMMLALWFYAYSKGITSTRQLEELCYYDTRYIYISCNLRPDHTTLSRFRKSHLDLLGDYFVQIVLIAEENGLSDFKHIFIDGSKIKASCSARQSYTEDQLNRKIEAIRGDIDNYMQRCNFAEQEEINEFDLETLRTEKERLEALEKKLIERREQLQERKKTLKPEHRKNHQINIIEPEARFMPHAEGPNYNAQAAVHNETHFIMANDVTDDPNDQNQFARVHQKVEENIRSDPDRAYTTDSGYHSLSQLDYIEEKNIDALIADPTPNNRSNNSNPTPPETILSSERKVERKDFAYHAEDDYYECPAGNRLIPVSNRGSSTIYRASSCQSCQLSRFCLSGKSKVKQIHRDHREELAEKMSRKLKSDDAKTRMKMRATSVEPVFGNLKQNLGFRRFNLRGLQNVKGEFNLMCIAHNINILFKLMQKKRLAAVIYASQININQHIAISKNILALILQGLARILFFPYRVKYGIIQL